MTSQEWFTEANGSRDKVKSLISKYHPIYRQSGTRATDKITAGNAERVCENIRKEIQETTPEDFDPVNEYQNAIDIQNVNLALKILSETWFGVPESTSCWQIYGFREAVRLMEDPPNERTNRKIPPFGIQYPNQRE